MFATGTDRAGSPVRGRCMGKGTFRIGYLMPDFMSQTHRGFMPGKHAQVEAIEELLASPSLAQQRGRPDRAKIERSSSRPRSAEVLAD